MKKIEIFAMNFDETKKVSCSGCSCGCSSKDNAALTGNILMNMLKNKYGDSIDIIGYEYETGNKNEILKRQNELFRENNVKTVLNAVIINILHEKYWPSVAIDGRIISVGNLMDMTLISEFE